MHCLVVNHYFEGGFYPRGGPGVIAENIIPIIEEAGGRVLVSKKVQKILIDKEGKAYGVRMENGVEIKAKNIISSAGVNNTFRELLDPNLDICTKLNSIVVSDSLLQLFVGFNKSGEELGLKSENVWSLPNSKYDQILKEFNSDPANKETVSFIVCPSTKDTSWNERYKGKSTAVVMCPISYKTVAKWKNNKNEEYKKFKEKVKAQMLKTLFKYYPKTKNAVVYSELGTPLTYNTFINSRVGEVYGISNGIKRYREEDFLKSYTDIENLYLTGQDILTIGFGGALFSGYLTANIVLGYNVFHFVTKQDLINDII